VSKNSQRIQILIGKRTYEPLKEWYQNQVNPNESARRILEHFIRIYGTEDVNSYEIQKKMAKELLNHQEVVTENTKINTQVSTVQDSPKKELIEQVNKKDTPINQSEETQAKPIINRGNINV